MLPDLEGAIPIVGLLINPDLVVKQLLGQRPRLGSVRQMDAVRQWPL